MPIPTLRRHTTTILLIFVAAGFAFLLSELLLMGHTHGSQLIAIDEDRPGSAPAEGREARGGETGGVIGEAIHSFANNPPVLSPLALSGLSFLGIMVLLTAEAVPERRQVTGQALDTQAAAD